MARGGRVGRSSGSGVREAPAVSMRESTIPIPEEEAGGGGNTPSGQAGSSDSSPGEGPSTRVSLSTLSRLPRFTHNQCCALVHAYMARYQAIHGTRAASYSVTEKNRLWDEIRDAVNALGEAPRHRDSVRKKVTDICASVRKKLIAWAAEGLYDRQGRLDERARSSLWDYQLPFLNIIGPDTIFTREDLDSDALHRGRILSWMSIV